MSTPTTVKDIAEKMAKGKELNKTEKKFYESNSDAIEKELSAMSTNDRSNITGDNNSSGSAAPAPAPSYNPLSESVDEKGYTGAQPNAQAASGGVVPEHIYQAPPEETYAPEKQISKEEEKQKKAREEKTANPDFEGKSDMEKEHGAEQMAEVIFNTMDTLYKGINKLMMISEKTIAKKQNSGEINTRVEVPYKMGYAPLSQVFQQYNADAKNLLVVEEEWKEAVRPPLIEELAKAGHGMSSRQVLVYMFSVKLAGDAFKVFQFLSLKKDYLAFAKEQTTLNRKVGRRPVVANAPAPTMQEHEEEVVEEQVSQPSTLQEQAMNKMFPQDMAGPNFGSTAKLSELNKLHKKDLNAAKKEARETISNVKHKIERNLASDPIPDGKKRGRGRPPGAKNRPKGSPRKR